MDTKSIMHEKIVGLLVISGLQGVGKSTLAFTLEHPDLTFILDFDLKGEKMAKEYGIKSYHVPTFMTPDMDPRDYDPNRIADWAIEKLKLAKGHTHVIIDNATALEAGLEIVIEKNPTKYGLNASNVAAGRFGGANPGISILWNNLTNWLQNMGVRTITMVNHMTQPWTNQGPIPNRFNIKGNKIFRNLSVGTFILVPGDAARGGIPPQPSGLVIKEALANRKFDEKAKKFVTQRTLPFRIPVATWENISAYFDKPANFAQLAIGEVWSSAEVDSYGEYLSRDQLAWIKEAAKIGFSEEGPRTSAAKVDPIVTGKQKLFNEVKESYKTMNDLAKALGELQMTYSLEKHDEIKQALLKKAGK